MKVARRNRPPYTEEQKEKIRQGCIGINTNKKSEEHKEALRKPKNKKYEFNNIECLYCGEFFNRNMTKNIPPLYCCSNHMKYYHMKKNNK
jgi:hypothetical protein